MEELSLPEMTFFDYVEIYLLNPASLLLILGGGVLLVNNFRAKKLPKWTTILAGICAGAGLLMWAAIGFITLMFASENQRFSAVAQTVTPVEIGISS